MQQLPYFLLGSFLIALVGGQQPGSATRNQVLKVPMEECQAGENCQKGKKKQAFDLFTFNVFGSVAKTGIGSSTFLCEVCLKFLGSDINNQGFLFY